MLHGTAALIALIGILLFIVLVYLGISRLLKKAKQKREILHKNLLYQAQLGNVNAVNDRGTTMLMTAIRNGFGDVVELCLENGADIHAASRNGDTALHDAAGFGYRRVPGRCGMRTAS